MFWFQARNILETPAIIFGSLGRGWRVISCKSGHIVGMVVTIEATIVLGRLDLSNTMLITVVLGERNKGMNGIDSPAVHRNWRSSGFKKGAANCTKLQNRKHIQGHEI